MENEEFETAPVSEPTTRLMNQRLFAVSLLLLAGLIAGSYVWHRRQALRLGQYYLDAATTAEREGDWRHAASVLRYYLGLNPHDLDGLVRFANAVEQGAKSPGDLLPALNAYLEASSLAPERHDLRLRIAEIQLLNRLPAGALKGAEEVLADEPNNPDALRIKALALYGNPEDEGSVPTSMIASFKEALERDPGDIQLAMSLAYLYRLNGAELVRTETILSADDVEGLSDLTIDRMVDNAPDRAEALLARYVYRRHFGRFAISNDPSILDPDLEEALRLRPDHLEILLAIAERLLDSAYREGFSGADRLSDDLRERLLAIEQALRERLAGNEFDRRIYRRIGDIDWATGRLDDAEAILREGLRRVGEHTPALNVRFVELLMELGRWDEARKTLDRLGESVRKMQGDVPLDKLAAALRRFRSRRARLEDADQLEDLRALLSAQWYLAKDNPQRSIRQATDQLKSMKSAPQGSRVSTVAHFNLGRCYSEVREWDAAAEAFRQAIGDLPNGHDCWLGAAEAHRRGGRIPQAIAEYQRALQLAEERGVESPVAQLGLALALLDTELRLAETERTWDRFDDALGEAKRALPDSVQPVLLELRSLLMRDPVANKDTVLEGLKEGESRFPRDPDFWRSACDLYLQVDRLDDSRRALEQLEALTGKRAYVTRVLLDLASGRSDEAEAMLAASDDAIDPEERADLLAAQAKLRLHQRRFDEARPLLLKLVELDPAGFEAPFELGLIAIRNEDADEAERWENRLLEIDGATGTRWRYLKVHRLVIQGLQGDKGAIEEATAASRDLLGARPDWSLAIEAAGTVSEAQGRFDEAINSYRHANHLGDRRPELIRRLVGLLLLKRQTRAAETILQELPRRLLLTPELIRLAVSVWLEREDKEAAVVLAKQALIADPSNRERSILVAMALVASNDESKLAEAEAHLLRAVRLAPNDLLVRLALLHFQVRNDRPDRAIRCLATLGSVAALLPSDGNLDPATRGLLIGRCLELDNDLATAEKYYRLSAQRQGSETPWRGAEGSFVAATVHSTSASVTNSRIRYLPAPATTIIGLLLATGSPASREMARGLLENEPRMRAVAFAYRGTPEAARAGLESLSAIPDEERRRGDDLLAIRLSRQLGETGAALRALAAVVRRSTTATQILECVDLALELDAVDLARGALESLPADATPAPDAALARIRLLAASDKLDDAVALAREQAATIDPTTEPHAAALERVRSLAYVLEGIGRRDVGIELLRRSSHDEPIDDLVLAEYLSRSAETIPESLRLLRAVAEREGPQRAALLGVQIALRGRLDDTECQLVERMVERALVNDENSSGLLAGLALLRERSGRVAEAIAICRRAVEQSPDDATHLNNLAWLLSAYEGRNEEALTLVDRAIALAGPVPTVLDTKGIVLLGLGRSDEAIPLFEKTLTLALDSTATLLHLAEALERTGHRPEAERAFRAVERSGESLTTPRDRDSRANLAKLFGS